MKKHTFRLKFNTVFSPPVFLVIFYFHAFLPLSCAPAAQPASLQIWDDRPATEWMTQALPIGNGYMGAMVFGQPATEQIQFSEGSLWAGGPGADPAYQNGNRPGAAAHLPAIRALIRQGKLQEADRLASRELTGLIHPTAGGPDFGDYGAQQTMGDLFISLADTTLFTHPAAVQAYRRSLDLETATLSVDYQTPQGRHQRRYFASYPAGALVYELRSDKPTAYRLRLSSPHPLDEAVFAHGCYRVDGRLAQNGQAFGIRLLLDSGSEVSMKDGELWVAPTRHLTIYHTAATDYTYAYPHYRGHDFRALLDSRVAALRTQSPEALHKAHVADYQALFHQVRLHLDGANRAELPTAARLDAAYHQAPDPGLEALYFQYGRYLMISASRPGTLPMHLQGKWNHSTNPPWACDYHTNINQQMLYWPAEVTGLGDCHLPLFDFMESLVAPGQASARDFFGMPGWIVNTMCNAYGFTAPGWGFPWGFFPAGAAWLCQHAWEHYAFTQDRDFLAQRAWPLMKEAALFWLAYLTEDEAGRLVSSPSYSPEHGGISGGASMDHQIVWDLFTNCLQAAEVLDLANDFTREVAQARDRICPPQIGRWGQLQEWKEDVDDPQNTHRHVSHLFALYPGRQVSVIRTPELARAAKTSLLARGDDGTGWSLAWKISFWARLKDGDHAYKMLRELLRPVMSQETRMAGGGGTYNNLFCAHPPFQLDGNMGGVAGMAEMLIQSHEDLIELLPALPAAWPGGRVSGLKARGAYTLDLVWKEGALTQVQITASPKVSGDCTLKYGAHQVTFTAVPGQVLRFDGQLKTL